jgi:cytochrome c oxidase subunit IV
MSEAHAHPHPNYMMVFYILFAATVAEVGVTYLGLGEGVLIVLLMAMAFFKAILVALYFMHLRFDNPILSIIAGTPLVLAAIAFAVVTYEAVTSQPVGPDSPPAAKVETEHAAGH